MTRVGRAKRKLEPLKITCTSSNCGSGLHCFKATKKMLTLSQGGRCRSCGEDLVDWARVQRQDATDAAHTFRMLQKEMIRHHFWHVTIDERAINHARRKGQAEMRVATAHRIRTSVGTKTSFDGRQTPKAGNAIFYAQHATAACCRKCIEEWHGIPRERPLTEAEITYLTKLCRLYIQQRLPWLPEEGERVPSIRTSTEKVKNKNRMGRRR